MSVFSYISDLPPHIQEVLDIRLQEAWLRSFNEALQVTTDERMAYQVAWFKTMQLAFPGEVMGDPSAMPQMLPNPAAQGFGPQNFVAPSQPNPYGFSEHAGYIVKLADAQINDSDESWIHAMPLGTYNHPKHGKIDFTPERVKQFAANVNSGVRDQQLDIDYDHKEYSGEAAGWVKSAEAKPDGLWLLVQWTRNAATKIKEGAYKYFSPEFVDRWVHPKTKQEFKDVLFGGGITNRPFLKDILPINLSEVLTEALSDNAQNNGGKMDPKEIAKLLGLPEDTPEADLNVALKAKLEAKPEDDKKKAEDEAAKAKAKADAEAEKEKEKVPVSASELKKLSETDPVVRFLSDEIMLLKTANRQLEINRQLSELDTDEYVVAPAVKEKIKALMEDATPETSSKLSEIVKELAASGIVSLKETGGRKPDGGASTTATKRFTELAEAKQAANKDMSYVDALNAVATEEPKLFEEYQNESYVKERG